MTWEQQCHRQTIGRVLTWYYQCAESACGLRSSAGGIEDALGHNQKCGPARDGMIHVSKAHAGKTDNDPSDDRLKAYGKERRIHQRLTQLDSHTQTVLFRAYGSVRRIGDSGLSVELLTATPTATKEYAVYVHKAAVAAARSKRHKGTMTMPEWLANLSDVDLFSVIRGEAMAELDAALEACERLGCWDELEA